VSRIIALLAVVVVAAACQTQAQPAPTPVPSPSPHTSPTVAVLQAAEVPAGLAPCSANGTIDAYLAALATGDPTATATEATAWADMRAEGAAAGAIAIFASDPSACSAELGATTNVKSVTSVVIEFADPWGAGIFGFAPPAPAEVVPGVTRGTATGLGLSSFTYVRTPLLLASWHRSIFVALVVMNLVDVSAFTAATAAVDARLN
jgi:hypothetical protein